MDQSTQHHGHVIHAGGLHLVEQIARVVHIGRGAEGKANDIRVFREQGIDHPGGGVVFAQIDDFDASITQQLRQGADALAVHIGAEHAE